MSSVKVKKLLLKNITTGPLGLSVLLDRPSSLIGTWEKATPPKNISQLLIFLVNIHKKTIVNKKATQLIGWLNINPKIANVTLE
tara:strand:- start:2208 stop:2459 length:252 start_codon:yes stop_codon:yes gene_type:complete